MPVDSMTISRHYRNVRDASLKTLIWQPSLPYSVRPNEVYDPTLTNQYVYGNRSDWYAAVACTGLNDVDTPVQEGGRYFLTPQRLLSFSPSNKTQSDKLY